jgi:hypothetical protein
MATAVATNLIKVKTAQNFVDAITAGTNNVYVAIAHTDAWANDSAPDSVSDNTDVYVDFWRAAIGGKKITGNEISLVIPRNDWTANTVYVEYSNQNANTLYNQKFFVMTEDYNVYKCISNNNSANSTIKPTYLDTITTNKETDGYIWKYMYTLSTSDRIRYLTSDWIPVRYLESNDGSLQWLVQENAIDGGIEFVKLGNTGSGFTNTSNIIVTITGDGTGANITASLNTTSQTVSNLTVISAGTGYHFANVAITGGGGSNATANAVIAPFGGHGSNPVNELGGSTVMINLNLKSDENGFITTQNDYRQIVLLQDPIVQGSNNTVFSNTRFQQSMEITVSTGAGDYSLDEYVYQGGSLSTASFSGRVLSWDNTNNKVELIETVGSPSSSLLVGDTSATQRFVLSTSYYDLKPYSGDLLYIENISPIQRAADQTENIKLILRF